MHWWRHSSFINWVVAVTLVVATIYTLESFSSILILRRGHKYPTFLREHLRECFRNRFRSHVKPRLSVLLAEERLLLRLFKQRKQNFGTQVWKLAIAFGLQVERKDFFWKSCLNRATGQKFVSESTEKTILKEQLKHSTFSSQIPISILITPVNAAGTIFATPLAAAAADTNPTTISI